MTKINNIRIHGFKSFAHKTDIPFDNEFNCILGPNGSGKSNVGDALCFVLGRLSAKSMRAEKAANLVFNGAKNKKPGTSASVEIAFCNKNNVFPVEAKEVLVNRTLTTKGNSVYKVNGKKHTRSEVVDLLSHAKINPDGHNVILQGDIMRFVDMSPTERRKIIEGISDVTLYEEKKHKANLELTKVEEKLNNAAIILKERRTHLNELKKDRDQALKYKEAKDTIDSRKATLLNLQIQERSIVKEKFDAEAAGLQAKIDSSEKAISDMKKQVESHRADMKKLNDEIEQKGEKQQLKVHKSLEDLKIALAQDKTRASTLKDELNKINQRKDQLTEELSEVKGKSSMFAKEEQEMKVAIERKGKEFSAIQENIAEFKKKNKIESSQELDQELENKDKLIDQKQEDVHKLRQQQQELLREKDKLEYQTQTMQDRMKKVQKVKKEHQGQVNLLEQQKNKFKQATLKLNQMLDQESSFVAQISNAKGKVQALIERQAQLQVKSSAMQDVGNQAFKAVKSKKGVYGTVASLGQVPDKYGQSLERAAGAKLQHIVVDSDKTAAECIRHLKQTKLGTAAFIPLNKIKAREITADDKKILKESGVHDFALNLVSFKPQFKQAFANVFGNTVIVEDLDTARRIGIGTARMATLDGNIAESSGVMRGGFMQKRGRVGFQETGALEELSKVDKEIAEMQNVVFSTQNKREAHEQAISGLRKQRAELEGEVIKLEKSLHLDTDDLEASGKLQEQQQSKLQEVSKELLAVQKTIGLTNRELAELKSKKQILRSQVSQLRNPRLLAQMSAFEDSQRQTREDILRLEGDLKNKSSQLQQMLAPEQEKMQEIMKQHDKEETQFKLELEKLTSGITLKEKDLVQKEAESKEFYSKYKSLFNEREKLSTAINKAEHSMEQTRDKSRTFEREINLMSLKNAEVKAKLGSLQDQFEKFKEVPLLEGKSEQQLENEIHKAEEILGQMSAVNMKALEIYEQIETEYSKLMDKKESLGAEKTDVLSLMNEIETKKKEHFMKTFNQANDNFKRIFTNLFKKGKAHLELDNPDQPFEDGLSVKVKLTGNRFMDIKSLSGGEKTLTALSFIFAIQEYEPSSFYILDEVDAALDKHNSEKLSKLIRNYSGNAQYIVISHNDSLISEADTLFGVSMQEGISKVTSLKI